MSALAATGPVHTYALAEEGTGCADWPSRRPLRTEGGQVVRVIVCSQSACPIASRLASVPPLTHLGPVAVPVLVFSTTPLGLESPLAGLVLVPMRAAMSVAHWGGVAACSGGVVAWRLGGW